MLKCNVVLIAVDALRADHLGLYGYKKRETSPRIDALARSAVVFENAHSQSNWTLPSFATIFTSMYPTEHGANSGEKTIPPGFKMLAEILSDEGFRTAGFVGGHFLDPVFGFGRGFDLYRAPGIGRRRYFQNSVPQALEWLKKNRDSRFFLFVHGDDLHPPFDITEFAQDVDHVYEKDYRGPVDDELMDYTFLEAYNSITHPTLPTCMPLPDEYKKMVASIRDDSRTVPHLVAHYDARIRELDERVADLFRGLGEIGRDRDTIVVLISDHGMEWGQKGVLATGHHPAVWETLNHVPMILWHPEMKPRRIKEPVELRDLAPTLLELAGIPAHPSFGGESLADLARGEGSRGRRLAFSTGSRYFANPEGICVASIRDDRWKLQYELKTLKSSLYDLKNDPEETRNVIEGNPDIADDLLRELLSRLVGGRQRKSGGDQ